MKVMLGDDGEELARGERHCIWIRKSMYPRGDAEESTRGRIKEVQLNTSGKTLSLVTDVLQGCWFWNLRV